MLYLYMFLEISFSYGYEKKVLITMVFDATNINKMNNPISY